MKKRNIFSTGIQGLDQLFKQGLYIDGTNEKGLIILIKGDRGTNKTELALQMMYGLSVSLLTSMDEYKKRDKLAGKEKNNHNYFLDREKYPSIYYSMTKSNAEIVPLCLDISVKENVDLCVKKNTICKVQNSDRSHGEIVGWLSNYLMAVFQNNYLNESSGNTVDFIKFAEQLLNGTAVYNSRSHKLETVEQRQEAQRGKRKDRFGVWVNTRYVPALTDKNARTAEANKKELEEDGIPFFYNIIDEKDLKTENLKFLFKENSNKANPLLDHSHPNAAFRAFYEDILELENDYQKAVKKDANKRPVVVMDGFSHIPDRELYTLPYNALFTALRKIARVSILVMDNRDVVDYDADIVIYTRHKHDVKNDYDFTELQIGKCVFQESALGWHQYKLRDKNIEVYPSVHRILSQPSYYYNKSVNIGESIFKDYVDEKGCPLTPNNPRNCAVYNYNQIGVDNNTSLQKLEGILCGKKDSWEDAKYPVGTTALIGNPHTYKRFLCDAITYNLTQQEIHTLYIFFDKNSQEMRAQILCPAYPKCPVVDMCMLGEKNPTCANNCTNLKSGCINRIHSIDLLHGCLSADEFFYMLQDKIDIFTKDEHGIQRHGLHIVIDDLQIIEYCFPMLIDNPLFLSTLVSVCRKNRVKLTILSDKHAKLVNSLCALADNILSIRRENGWVDRMEIYVERGAGDNIPVYAITNPRMMFRCLGSYDGLAINSESIIHINPRGSMKHYWRDSLFVTNKEE